MARGLDLRFHQRARGVEARSGAPGVDLPREAVLRGDVAGRSERHQNPAAGDEPLQLEDTRDSHPAGDVLGRAVVAQEPVAIRFRVGSRTVARLDVEHQALGGSALVRNQDDVVVRSQIALPDPLLEDQVEGNLELVERVADPAHLLGVAPGAVHRQPGQIDRVGLDVRRFVERGGGQAQLDDPLLEARGAVGAVSGLDDEGPGREFHAARLEAFLGRVDRRGAEPVAQSRQVIRAVVGDGVAEARVAVPGCRAGDPGQLDGLDRRVQNRRVLDGDHFGPQHQSHRPAGVVVGPQAVVGELLVAQQDLREPEVRLAALDDVGTGRVGVVAERQRPVRAPDLDALDAQQVDEGRHPRHVALTARNDEAVRRVALAVQHRVSRLAVVVPEDDLGVRGRELQRGEGGGLAVVGVVAHRPFDLLVGGRWPVPLAAGAGLLGSVVLGLQMARHRRRTTVAERFVEADQSIVVRGHERQVAWRPHVDEAVGPDAGHAVAGQLGHLEVREPRQLAVDDGVEQRVLRWLSAERVEERDRLVQVVHHRRMPLQVPVEHVPHAPLRIVDVPVVVVEDVLAPVRRAADSVAVVGDVDQVPVVPVDVAVAAVRLGGRNQGHDQLVADPVEERSFLDGEPIGELHQHLRRAGLAAVQAGHEEIDRLGFRDDDLCFRFGESAGVGEPGEVAAIPFEVRERRFVRDRHDDHLAILVGPADRADRDARGGSGQRPVVLQHLRVVGQLARRAGVVAEDVLRRRDAIRDRQVIDQRAEELGPRGPLLDAGREVGIQRLSAGGLGNCRGGDQGERGGDGSEPLHGVRLPGPEMVSVAVRCSGSLEPHPAHVTAGAAGGSVVRCGDQHAADCRAGRGWAFSQILHRVCCYKATRVGLSSLHRAERAPQPISHAAARSLVSDCRV